MSDKKPGSLYHLILGLPEEIPSPNHYELLGLDHRTSDPQLIKKAATDQNRKLLHWQNSDRYAEVRALTLEIVHARDVLLNEASRSAYDATLGEWGIVEEPPRQSPSAEPLSVRCPDCKASFKLRNRELIGRRMPCPDCGFRFTVRPEAEPLVEVIELDAVSLWEDPGSDAELSALDNFEDMEDLPKRRTVSSTPSPRRPSRQKETGVVAVEPYPESDDYETRRPAFGSRSPSRNPSRRKSAARAGSRSSGRWAVIAGGALMAFASVVLVGVFVQRSLSSSTVLNPHLAYLPADCQAVGYYRLGDVSRSPFFQDHLTRSFPLRNQVDQFRGRTGMELQDLETVVIGLKENDPGRFHSLGVTRNSWGLRFVAVARATKDWDRSRLIGDHTQSASHNNQTYHVFSPEDNSAERWALYLPDARTLVFGSVPEVEAAIDTAGKVPPWEDLEFLQPEYPIITARVGRSADFRGPRPTGFDRPSGMNATTQGSGLVLAGDEVRQVAFRRFDTPSDAAEYVRTKSPPEFSGGGGSASFTQHGRTVAISQGGFTRIAHAMHGDMAAAPLSLLARLGDGSPASNTTSRADPPANAIVQRGQSPPAEPL